MASKAKHSDRSKSAAQDSTREDRIRGRAYEIYLERGEEPGREIEDWLRAEHELTTEMSKAAVA